MKCKDCVARPIGVDVGRCLSCVATVRRELSEARAENKVLSVYKNRWVIAEMIASEATCVTEDEILDIAKTTPLPARTEVKE